MSALVDDEGKSMQCDVECGRGDRQVYLLVPEHHVQKATSKIKQYLARITNLRPPIVLNYTPSAAIITNVDFLRTMSQSNVWQNFTNRFSTAATFIVFFCPSHQSNLTQSYSNSRQFYFCWHRNYLFCLTNHNLF